MFDSCLIIVYKPSLFCAASYSILPKRGLNKIGLYKTLYVLLIVCCTLQLAVTSKFSTITAVCYWSTVQMQKICMDLVCTKII